MPAPQTLDATPGSTIAADGTRLGWLSVGEGPGLVIVHGAMQSARSQLDLARLLAGSRRVHLVDRRGRGLSGPIGAAGPYTGKEVDDLAAVLSATGARDILGVSSGALIALRAGLVVPSIDRIIAFEPPLSIDHSVRLDLLDRFLAELTAGDRPNALVSAMLAAEMGPPPLLKLPRAVLRMMTRPMLNGATKPGDVPISDLVTALRVDMRIVAENAERLQDFAEVRNRTLLLDGTKTRPYLRTATAGLAATIPNSRRISLDGTNHSVTSNRAQRGKPDLVAPVLAEFLAVASTA